MDLITEIFAYMSDEIVYMKSNSFLSNISCIKDKKLNIERLYLRNMKQIAILLIIFNDNCAHPLAIYHLSEPPEKEVESSRRYHGLAGQHGL